MKICINYQRLRGALSDLMATGSVRMRKVGEVGMTDMEKVIKGLEHCLSRFVDGLCDDCPYMGELDKSYMIPMKCKEIIMRDALALLKEQEAKTGNWIYRKYDDMFMCSSCEKYSIRNDYPYCHWCGAKMEGR